MRSGEPPQAPGRSPPPPKTSPERRGGRADTPHSEAATFVAPCAPIWKQKNKINFIPIVIKEHTKYFSRHEGESAYSGHPNGHAAARLPGRRAAERRERDSGACPEWAGDCGYRQRCPQGAEPSKRDAQGRPHDIVAGTAPFFPHV